MLIRSSAARILIMPRPPSSLRMRSESFSAGSPKNSSAPSRSSTSKSRMIALTETDAILPYSSDSSLLFSAIKMRVALRSLRSISGHSCVSATSKAIFITPSCALVSPIRRDSNIGPISEMVARMGWPFAPCKSQKVTGMAL